MVKHFEGPARGLVSTIEVEQSPTSPETSRVLHVMYMTYISSRDHIVVLVSSLTPPIDLALQHRISPAVDAMQEYVLSNVASRQASSFLSLGTRSGRCGGTTCCLRFEVQLT